MKICLINLRALPVLSEEYKHERMGGEEVQHALLAKALAELGHEVRLVVGDFGQEDGAQYEGVTTLKAFKEGTGLIGVCRGLWAALERANADVYYYSCAGPMLGVLAAFCEHNERRLVYRVARDDDCTPDVAIKWPHHRWMYHYGLKRADAILVQTASQQRALQLNHGLASRVAGMLVDIPTTWMTPTSDVIWVANIKPEKRPQLLLELAQRLPDVRFRMVGACVPGHVDLFEQITAQARALPNVIFHGAVPYRDVGSLFDRARVFVNTSELEGFPNTFLQAWVRGMPVVTTFDPDGLVAAKGLGSTQQTVAGLAYSIRMLLHSAALYAQTSNRVVDFMQTTMSPSAVMADYLEAFYGPIAPWDWLDDAGACERALRAKTGTV